MRILAGLAAFTALAVGGDHYGSQLDWLAGCWVSMDKSAQEVWVVESDQSLVGYNVVLDDNKVRFYEVLSIKPNEDGTLVYTPHPFGQPSASFAATEVTENSVVFTNPDHDYPQEVKYTREGNRLNATISLLGGANPTHFDKVACD